MTTAILESGEIAADSVYTLKELMRRAGLGRMGMQSARRKGLRVIRKHNRAFVRGSDWIAYLESEESPEN